ncbi:hypothetical protein EZV62_019863 [Acer yangbiense]|uniref:Uncharacterized protein n=1 Tax=Acer yangbiense TaxID=1000413 RepID=A0A5C7HCE0_9ROSI|nr:hypothetical protein EZV62_019863 [Acer yangbiense]
MKPCRSLITRPIKITAPPSPPLHLTQSFTRTPNAKMVLDSGPSAVKFPVSRSSTTHIYLPVTTRASSPAIASNLGKLEAVEENIEKVIYRCRFMAFLGVLGSLIGSFLCFIKGCTFVAASFAQFFVNRGKIIFLLVEAIVLVQPEYGLRSTALKAVPPLAFYRFESRILHLSTGFIQSLTEVTNINFIALLDVYLLGTVMLVFGMGLYELFVSNLDIGKMLSEDEVQRRSNLFGLFTLKERPKWLEVKTVSELKTKLGHVIVMLLLIGLFDKSKKAAIHTPVDLLCFSASILLSAGCLFLLSKLSDSK